MPVIAPIRFNSRFVVERYAGDSGVSGFSTVGAAFEANVPHRTHLQPHGYPRVVVVSAGGQRYPVLRP